MPYNYWRANIEAAVGRNRAEPVREIQKSHEADSLRAKKRVGAPRVAIQRAAQD